MDDISTAGRAQVQHAHIFNRAVSINVVAVTVMSIRTNIFKTLLAVLLENIVPRYNLSAVIYLSRLT